jgi:hypothetical protein
MNGPRIEPLVEAIWDGDLKTVRALIDAEPSWLAWTDDNGTTPLMYAVGSSERSVELVEFFLDLGADVRARTKEGYTALHSMVDVNGPTGTGPIPGAIARMLVDAGADSEVRQHWGWTPLMQAAVEGTVDELKALVDVGSDLNKVFPSHTLPEFLRGRTTLMATASDPDMLKVLLDAGADASAVDAHGDTLLEYTKGLLIEHENQEPLPEKSEEEIVRDSVNSFAEIMEEMGHNIDDPIGKTGETWRQMIESTARERASEPDALGYDYGANVRESIQLIEDWLRDRGDR